MKNLILIFSITVVSILSGCLPMPPPPDSPTSQILVPSLGVETSIGMGDDFFTYVDKDYGCLVGFNVNSMYKLTLVGLTKETVSLEYSEFLCDSRNGLGKWLIKDGYNKRLDYSIEASVITFKGYEFNIISISNGQLKYRRVK